MKIELLGQVRGWDVLILNQAYSHTMCSSSFFLHRLHAHFLWEPFLLYSPSILHPNLPFVDLIDDLLDACPIQNLLEILWIAVNWDITVQVSFPHKCDQLVRCRAFNVVVATFFSDISSLVVGYLPWNLFSKDWLPFVQHSRGGWVPTFHNAFPRKLSSSGPTISSLFSFLFLGSLIPKLNRPWDHPRAFMCPQAQPTTQLSYLAYLPSQI